MPESEKSSVPIIEAIKRIALLEEVTRSHINTTRYQTELLQNLDNWNQICSSLDTIGDTLYSIQDYLEIAYPKSAGLKYIYTYGLLQALFIQQDAICHLSEAFELEFKLSEKLKQIRALRNASIGHPTKNNVKGAIYYNYISRITLSKYGFTLMRSFEQGRNEFIDVDIISTLIEQLDEIEASYNLIAIKLTEADRVHKEKFKDKMLADLLPSSMGYLFSKVAEGIHSPSGDHVSFGLSMLKSIQETYREFEQALAERRDLNEYIKYDLDEYNHALAKLKDYLTRSDSGLTDSDARIYHFYIREQHNHFVQIAKEIDEDYL